MSRPDSEDAPAKVRGFIRGLHEAGEFLTRSALAVWDFAFGRRRKVGADDTSVEKPAPPDEGMSVLEKIAPFPSND